MRQTDQGLPESDRTIVTALVDANRILVARGVLDAFGHVSARSAADPDRFYLARNMAPGRVTSEDIQAFTLDAQTDDPRPSYLEKYIHAEIYRARPDVTGVVHSHSPAVIPFAVTDRPLRPVLHMAGFLADAVPVFEIRDHLGEDSDLLIRDARTGAALADALGPHAVVLMRGHGSVAVGDSLPDAVFRAVYAEVNAGIQAAATQLGAVTYLTPQEGAAAWRTNSSQVVRAWDVWREEVRVP
ncbi:class II aldolase/adducin family protein [Georgenia sp. EYE_87]|uniref:class II aldolase/adducin family protein n=1 Tax=Georgenia sp. EYE_87 TaxID=2853448 RepID=UPI002006564D|nr:class II aldolase/adducin family protein [Georgenia sp. EYE_87]MCK6210776.1 class II aldolase/adducin family protein [Georgenia sp. EYE_87]